MTISSTHAQTRIPALSTQYGSLFELSGRTLRPIWRMRRTTELPMKRAFERYHFQLFSIDTIRTRDEKWKGFQDNFNKRVFSFFSYTIGTANSLLDNRTRVCIRSDIRISIYIDNGVHWQWNILGYRYSISAVVRSWHDIDYLKIYRLIWIMHRQCDLCNDFQFFLGDGFYPSLVKIRNRNFLTWFSVCE